MSTLDLNWTTTSGISEIDSSSFKNTDIKDDESYSAEVSSSSNLFLTVKKPKQHIELYRILARNNHTTHKRETLEKQFQPLEDSKSDLNTKKNADELHIQALQSTINDLKSKSKDLDLETSIENKNKMIRGYRTSTNVKVEDIKQDLEDEKIKELECRNTDLLAQNSALKNQNDKLRAKIELYLKPDSDFSDSESKSIRKNAFRVLGDEVETLLVQNNTSQINYSPIGALETYNPTIECNIALLTNERDKYLQSYKIEKEINHELSKHLEALRADADSLSIKFTRLSNDAEVAVASERIAQIELQDKDRSLHVLERRVNDAENKALKYDQLVHEYDVVVRTMEIYEKLRLDSKTEHEEMEEQWNKDREELIIEIENLKGKIENLQSQNGYLKRDLEERLTTLPTPMEHAKLYNDINKAGIALAKEETEQEALKKEISDHVKHLKLIKRDVSFKDEQIKKHEKTISNLEKAIAAIDSKSKLESKALLCKDTIIKTYKEKVKKYERSEIEQKTLAELKELSRKIDLVMHWKERALATKKELEQIYITKDKKLHSSINNLQISLRITREKLAESIKDLEKYKNRDKQYINVLSQFIMIASSYDVKNKVIDDDINSMAKKLSRQILELDWDEINAGGNSEEYKTRLEGVLSMEKFEENLFNLLTEICL